LCIAFKTVLETVAFGKLVQFLFRNMPERRMSEIVSESRRFGYIGVRGLQLISLVFLSAAEFLRDPTCELCYFQGMRKTVVKNITAISGYDLGNLGEP
jgi:hypothetical protein